MKVLNYQGQIRLICFLYESYGEEPTVSELEEIIYSININYNEYDTDYYETDCNGQINFFEDDFDDVIGE